MGRLSKRQNLLSTSVALEARLKKTNQGLSLGCQKKERSRKQPGRAITNEQPDPISVKRGCVVHQI